jgi:hypothetical protein
MDHAAPTDPAAAPRWRLAIGLTTALGTLAVGTMVGTGDHGGLPFILWLVCLGGLLTVAGRPRLGPPLSRRDGLALGAVTAVAAALRLWQIGSIPSGVWLDELAIAANSITLAAGPFAPFASTPLFADHPEWVHTSNLYLYACWPLVRLSGYGFVGVKLISLLPGIAAPPLLYLLARRVLATGWAAFAAGLLALSHWHVTASRWGFDQVLVTALGIVLIAALYDGLEHRHAATLTSAGVIAGLALYAYIAARLLLAAVVVVLVVRVAWLRTREPLRDLAAFGAGWAVAATPLVAYWLTHPGVFAVRMSELSIVGQALAGDLAPVLGNLRHYALMFFVRGDFNPRQNVPGEAMLDPLTALLFAIGLVIAALRWRRTEHQLAVSWLLVGLLGGVLTESVIGPNSYRTGHVVPACMLLAAVAAATLHRGFARARPHASSTLAPVAASAVLLSALTVTSVQYFLIRPQSRECYWAARDGVRCEMMRRLAEGALASGHAVLLDSSTRSTNCTLQFDVLTRRRYPGSEIRWVDATGDLEHLPAGSLLLIAPEAWRGLPAAIRSSPAVTVTSPFDEPVVVAVSRDR